MHKKILIIGGSSGLGRALAERYASMGDTIGIIGRRGALLQEVLSGFQKNVSILEADISKDNFISQLEKFIESLGGMDLCIIAASIIEFNEPLSLTQEQKTVDINVNGFARIANYAWHYFKNKGSGQLVGITSIAAARGNKQAPAYHASKSFQSIYLESLRVKSKFEKNGITITELVPGYMKTAMGKGDRMFWVVPIDKAVTQSIQAISDKREKAFISKRWWLIYQLNRFLPRFIYDRLVNSNIRFKN